MGGVVFAVLRDLVIFFVYPHLHFGFEEVVVFGCVLCDDFGDRRTPVPAADHGYFMFFGWSLLRGHCAVVMAEMSVVLGMDTVFGESRVDLPRWESGYVKVNFFLEVE